MIETTKLSGIMALSLSLLCLAGCAAHPTSSSKSHHTENGFRNIFIDEENSFADFLRWRWEALGKEIPGPEFYSFPLAENNPSFLRANRERTTLTWVGHATLLLQLNGKNILTDPVFDQRASPVQWAGPKRAVPPGIVLEQLPPIDIVLISHDHYDALSEDSIIALFERSGGVNTTFFVPLGLGQWFRKRGISRVVELDWWEKRESSGLNVTAAPVQHWSKRSLFSKNETLWAAWVVEAPDFRFFFAGDSGYCPHFKQIGEKFGGFDLAAIPIGAYEPRWFMAKHHMSPEEAVKTHLDIVSDQSVAIHWGTFVLTDEPLDEPSDRLFEAIREEGLEEDEFLVLKHGETIYLEKSAAKSEIEAKSP